MAEDKLYFSLLPSAFCPLPFFGNASGKKAIIWAFSESAAEFIFLAIAIVVGIYLGVHH